MIEKFNKNRLKRLENQLDIGFYDLDDSKAIFYIKYKKMLRTYHYGLFPFVYCIVEIELKKIKANISKNITETIYRKFRKHFEYYKNN